MTEPNPDAPPRIFIGLYSKQAAAACGSHFYRLRDGRRAETPHERNEDDDQPA